MNTNSEIDIDQRLTLDKLASRMLAANNEPEQSAKVRVLVRATGEIIDRLTLITLRCRECGYSWDLYALPSGRVPRGGKICPKGCTETVKQYRSATRPLLTGPKGSA